MKLHLVFYLIFVLGTLVQGAFVDRKCAIGLILGTGSNACYIEKAEKIEKWEGEHKDVQEVIISFGIFLYSTSHRVFIFSLIMERSSSILSGELLETMEYWISSKQNSTRKSTGSLYWWDHLRECYYCIYDHFK